MNKSTLIAGVMAFVAFTSCHSGKSGDHGEDIHAGEEHVESGEKPDDLKKLSPSFSVNWKPFSEQDFFLRVM